MTSGEDFQLARALSAMRQFLDDDVEPAQRVAVLNGVDVSDDVVAAFMAALPKDELVNALTFCERPGVLAVWAHSIGRLFRYLVAENPWASDETLVALGADYDEAVSAAAYRALVARVGDRKSLESGAMGVEDLRHP